MWCFAPGGTFESGIELCGHPPDYAGPYDPIVKDYDDEGATLFITTGAGGDVSSVTDCATNYICTYGTGGACGDGTGEYSKAIIGTSNTCYTNQQKWTRTGAHLGPAYVRCRPPSSQTASHFAPFFVCVCFACVLSVSRMHHHSVCYVALPPACSLAGCIVPYAH